MSGVGENRWRRSGQGNPKDGRQQASPAPGNVWGNKATQSNKPTGPGQAAPVGAPKEEHVPVREFNAVEVRDYLKKKYRETVAEHPAVYHKVEGDSVPKRSSGVWGARGAGTSHKMPNGQNFFDVLKKQLANLDQTK
ncbi:uncharacterized protein M421DRAFT_114353 [Didymella exigua CBS 183.55]|uniref:Uncharacterized protein n=1 Tax=Didymella exigua CBS 183.55 TaxID=1150837 RepID=A0A6A5S3Z7_9PLEO|nr:uncharacterized protein M421DRAFT_114353 [Didymella exigua CBS 183.55]KAF1934164.1 hypothetical protein M421DRAFT_114353 [Didymella exigua CBS 183.55]